MLQKIQYVFDSNFLAPHFIILFGLSKYVLAGSQKHVYMARQGMYTLFSRKQQQLYIDHKKSKISTNLNTVSIYNVTSYFGIYKVQALLLIVVNKKMLYLSQPFIAKLFKNKNFIFLLLYMVGKLRVSSVLIKKCTSGHIQEAKVIIAQRVVSKTTVFPIFLWQCSIFPQQRYLN